MIEVVGALAVVALVAVLMFLLHRDAMLAIADGRVADGKAEAVAVELAKTKDAAAKLEQLWRDVTDAKARADAVVDQLRAELDAQAKEIADGTHDPAAAGARLRGLLASPPAADPGASAAA